MQKKKKRQKKKKTTGISFFTVDCIVQSTVKGLKKKRKEKNKTEAYATGYFFFLHKKYQKRLRFKNVMFFYKDIPKSLWSSCNTWPKSNIYNIYNNIKLTWLNFKWVLLQHRTQEPWMWVWLQGRVIKVW